MFVWLSAIGSIILVDLVLSGDNALVIGAAASGLPKNERLLAIVCGGGGAIILRILFTIVVTFLLQLPFLQAAGGVVLIYIALRLLIDRNNPTKEHQDAQSTGSTPPKQRGFWASLFMIMVADATMSLDNVLAIGGISNGNFVALMIGLTLSIALILLGSAIIAALIGRFPLLLDLASLILVWTAANMFLEDHQLGNVLALLPYAQIIIPVVLLLGAILFDIYWWRHSSRKVAIQKL